MIFSNMLLQRLAAWALIATCALVAGCSESPATGAAASETANGAGVLSQGESEDSVSASLSGKITVTGSSTVAPLAAEIAVRFEERNPEVRIDVQTGGSSRGIADVRSGTAEIGMASRTLGASETDLMAHLIAVDGICFIVHKSNPVNDLSDKQVVDIFRGQVSNWNEVGGNDLPVVVVNKASGRATLEVFLHYFQLDSSEIKADIIAGENQQCIKTVAGNPSAIAYVSIGTVGAEIERGTSIRAVPYCAVDPTVEIVAAGLFPITRPLLLITDGEPSALQKAFIDFAQSSEVTDLIEAQYFVPPSR